MNKQQIIDLLNIGEHREVEFKESYKKLPKSLWETYSIDTKLVIKIKIIQQILKKCETNKKKDTKKVSHL